MWLMLLVLFSVDPVQSGDRVKFALPDSWYPTEAICNEKAAVVAAQFGKTSHVAYACFQAPELPK
jgi:hypothetical protein